MGEEEERQSSHGPRRTILRRREGRRLGLEALRCACGVTLCWRLRDMRNTDGFGARRRLVHVIVCSMKESENDHARLWRMRFASSMRSRNATSTRGI